jgi:hypothetical protein
MPVSTGATERPTTSSICRRLPHADEMVETAWRPARPCAAALVPRSSNPRSDREGAPDARDRRPWIEEIALQPEGGTSRTPDSMCGGHGDGGRVGVLPSCRGRRAGPGGRRAGSRLVRDVAGARGPLCRVAHHGPRTSDADLDLASGCAAPASASVTSRGAATAAGPYRTPSRRPHRVRSPSPSPGGRRASATRRRS